MIQEASLGIVALTRFGYGPRSAADVAEAARDPRGVLAAELKRPDGAVLTDPDLPSTRDALQLFFAERASRALARDRSAAAGPNAGAPATTGNATPPDDNAAAPAGRAKAPRTAQSIFRREALARVRRASEAPVGFVERLVAFWSNHFCVSAAKGGFARATAGAFEREAIRPHVLGRFADMLLAVESHPAMLHYLDNARSIGPASRVGQRTAHGLNENLGREILELHTLGVDAGYTQVDVTNLARILTGWTVVGPPGKLGEPGTFAFNGNAHEPGPITMLGTSYAGDGAAQGSAALADLARHPATAHHLSVKLARAFVADEPPPDLVAKLARRFRDTDGDLREMAHALIEAPESWSGSVDRVRDPYQFLIGAHRLIRRVPDEAGTVLGPLRDMGMALWQPPAPNGFPSDAASWAAPGSMKLRLDYAASFAQRLHDPPELGALLDVLCAGRSCVATRDAVARAESRAQAVALLLMSPEMQRI